MPDTIRILQMVLVTGEGPDKVGIEIDKPDPRKIANHLVLSFTCPEGTGEEFLTNNFGGIHFDVIRRGET